MHSVYAFRRPPHNSYLVRQRDRRRRRELAVVLLALLPVAGGMLGYVWLNVRLVRIGYEVHQLERVLKLEEQRERELLLEAAYLASPDRISERAARELGMMPADLGRLVFWEEAR